MVYKILALAGAAVASVASALSAQTPADDDPDVMWRLMYAELKCAAYAEGGRETEISNAHLTKAMDMLDRMPTVFSPRAPDYVPDGSEADRYGRPLSAEPDARFVLGRYFQIIAEAVRFEVNGPPPEYPEGMTVSPSHLNAIYAQRAFMSAYERKGCG